MRHLWAFRVFNSILNHKYLVFVISINIGLFPTFFFYLNSELNKTWITIAIDLCDWSKVYNPYFTNDYAILLVSISTTRLSGQKGTSHGIWKSLKFITKLTVYSEFFILYNSLCSYFMKQSN